jgi:putative Mn2+ efflux pump MntP
MLIFDNIGSTLLFGLAANTDNLTVGVAYGMKRRLIRWEQNLLIAAVTTVVTLLSLVVGRQIRAALSTELPDTIGGILLISLAACCSYREWTGAASWLGKPLAGASTWRPVLLGETLFLAGTLSINNIGLAIAGGIGGVSYAAGAASVFGFSAAMLALGQAVGTNFAQLNFVPQLLRNPMIGNGALAVAGAFMLAGY